MTGPEHYVEAEILLRDADEAEGGSNTERYLLAAAQVHATLAQAAATVAPLVDRYLGDSARTTDWGLVIGWDPTPRLTAEVLCGTEGCTGPDGHDGECGVAW